MREIKTVARMVGSFLGEIWGAGYRAGKRKSEPEPECYDDYGPPVCEACGKKLIGVFCGPCWYEPRGEPEGRHPRTALKKLESDADDWRKIRQSLHKPPPDSEPSDESSKSSAHSCDWSGCCGEPPDSEDMERR